MYCTFDAINQQGRLQYIEIARISPALQICNQPFTVLHLTRSSSLLKFRYSSLFLNKAFLLTSFNCRQ